MSEAQNAAYEAAYKVAYEAALEATKAAGSVEPEPPVNEDDETIELSFGKVKNAFKNHWIMITAVTLLFAVLGFLYSEFIVTPMYQASVNMIVQSNTSQSTDENVSKSYVDSAKSLADTYSQILNSSKIQNHVINELSLDMTARELGELAVASSVTDAQIVKVTVTTENAELSKSIAEAYLRLGPTDLNELVEAGKCNAVSGVEAKSDPIKPGMKRTVLMMAIVGFALSFAYALFREISNHFIGTTVDVKEQLGLPVLGVIPAYEVE